MEFNRTYARTLFPDTVLATAIRKMDELMAAAGLESKPTPTWTVRLASDSWKFDDEHEFFATYRDGCDEATIDHFYGNTQARLRVDADAFATRVLVAAPSRAQISEVVAVFDRARDAYYVPPPPAPPPAKPVVFVGHGRSSQWRILKDHLTDQHDIDVEAYEMGARAGHQIRDVLESMVNVSTIAFLVMTAEDEQDDGEVRTRQNVVHELGLFQGALGFSKAIAVAEQGVELFSNLDGVQQLRFSKDNIREVFGDVLATIRREFPGSL